MTSTSTPVAKWRQEDLIVLYPKDMDREYGPMLGGVLAWPEERLTREEYITRMEGRLETMLEKAGPDQARAQVDWYLAQNSLEDFNGLEGTTLELARYLVRYSPQSQQVVGSHNHQDLQRAPIKPAQLDQVSLLAWLEGVSLQA